MKKLFILVCMICMTCILLGSTESVYASGQEYYSVILEDGSVELIPYTDYDASYDVMSADYEDIDYGVVRIKGYTTYKEYDGTTSKTARDGYVHGDSANDAAFIGVVSNGTKVRVKLAGVYMDIPIANVSVSEYTSSSNVSYYYSKSGSLYHYYYYGSYSTVSSRGVTLVGNTPDYLKDGVKYYSYDGHYFYTDYKTMLKDYKSGVNVYTNAVNKNTPYYNYYQYLSFRAFTTLTKDQINAYLSKYTGPNTSKPNSKLYNQAEALLNNEADYGTNATLTLGIAINESAWGTSNYAMNYNNFFGLGVYDSNPDALSFDTVEEGFNYFSLNFISEGYLDGGDSRYRGPHLGDKQSGINVKYASDPYWGEKAAAFSYYMDRTANNTDCQYYDIAIHNVGNLSFYKDSALTTYLYSSGASVSSSTNLNVYNVPCVIISENSKSYKIYSDTTLKDDRSGLSRNTFINYDTSRDYVYINKSNVSLTYETLSKYQITLSKEELTLDTGDTYTLTASNTVSSWSSSNTSVVTVKDGKLTALKAGTATITAKTSYGVSATCTVTVVDQLPFTDVSSSDWYYSYVQEVYELGLMTGTSATKFKPTSPMNRAMVAIVLHRMEGSEPTKYQKLFKDVPDGEYYSEAVTWAKLNGVINGYTASGTFKPTNNITREEMVTMLYNFAKYKGETLSISANLTVFKDYENISSYAKVPMLWAVKNGVITGKYNGTMIDPQGTATRAECAKMLLVVYKMIY